MNSLEVYATMQTLPVETMVYAANKLPNSTPVPCGIIVNTDPDYKPGTHWVAIYIDEFRNGEYFDSYGLPPFVKPHKTFLRANCKKLIYNTHELQSLNSTVCGQYCLLFLHFRANGHSMADFQRLFSTNTLTNDALLKQKFDLCFKRRNVGNHESTHDTQSCCCRKNR